MAISGGTASALLLLGVLGAFVTLSYFVFRELQQDYETGNYHFTWAIGLVVLFLLGFAPDFVGLGLYLTVEREYPLHWSLLALFVVFAIVAAGGFGLYSETSSTAVEFVG